MYTLAGTAKAGSLSSSCNRRTPSGVPEPSQSSVSMRRMTKRRTLDFRPCHRVPIFPWLESGSGYQFVSCFRGKSLGKQHVLGLIWIILRCLYLTKDI